MTTAADIMTKEVITVKPETTLRELARIFSERSINGVPVVNETGDVLGVVCEADLVKQNQTLHIPTVFVILDAVIPLENPWRLHKEFKRLSASKVEEIYSRPAVCVNPNTDVSEIAELMSDRKYYTLPVVDGDKLVGVIGKSDLIKLLV
jgi:CBS domain-containing protein